MCYYIPMKTITEVLTNQQIKELKNKYFEYINERKLPYVNFQLKLDDCTITVYDSKKVVYQGLNPENYIMNKKEEAFEEAGSDEVGTGDYFGPVVVCAVYLDVENLKFAKKLQVTDSKQLSDETIRKIAPLLMEKIPHSLLILDNPKYNHVHLSNNLNQIKAKLHNKAYVHLKNKIRKLPKNCIVDQFTPKDLYYRYIQHEPEIITELTFETKAESKYPSVACASILARYAFLKVWDKIEEHYQVKIPKGSSPEVDKFAKEFIDQYGKEELKKIVKIHFKNSEKIGL